MNEKDFLAPDKDSPIVDLTTREKMWLFISVASIIAGLMLAFLVW